MIRRLLRGLLGVRCPICRERTRYLAAHVEVEHAELDVEPWYLEGSDE